MLNKFKTINWLVFGLTITNYLGWTNIPWLLLNIPAAIIVVIWIYAIIMASIIVIKQTK